MCPHAKDLDYALALQNLIYQSVQNVYSARYCAFEIPHQRFVWWRNLERVFSNHGKEPLDIGA